MPDTSAFPPADELWAWAHVHVNDLLSADPAQLVAPDMTAVIPRLRTLLAASQDVAYSRLLCPRRLADNTGYHAFVVPTFETGRLAGLGLDPAGAPHATFSAWAGYSGQPQPRQLPDLLPVVLPHRHDRRLRVPRRACSSRSRPTPGSAPATSTSPTPAPACPASPGPAWAACCGSAARCRCPTLTLTADQLAQRQAYENWDQPYPDDFQQALAAFVNLPDDYAAQTAAAANAASGLGPGVADDPDPLITAPLYGRWPALTQRLLTNRDGTPAPDTPTGCTG